MSDTKEFQAMAAAKEPPKKDDVIAQPFKTRQTQAGKEKQKCKNTSRKKVSETQNTQTKNLPPKIAFTHLKGSTKATACKTRKKPKPQEE